jgi:hypothetical protein
MQVVRTTNDVIINAMYLIGELGVGETPDPFMITTGLDLINELLDKFAADSIYIPYLTTINFAFTVGKDTYSISDMVPADITQDRIVDLSFANYFVPANGNPAGAIPISFPFTADSTTDLLTMASTISYPTNTPITISVPAGGVIPSPLVAGTTYWTINVSPTTLYLATTSQNALLGNFINILNDGTPPNVITAFNFPTQPVDASLCYPLRIINKATYWNVVRQTNLLARPGFIFLNKQATESFITVYPVPDQPYAVSIQVKCMLNELGNMQDIGELPPNYYGFLKYALARKLLAYYPSGNWPAANEAEYEDYYNTFKNCNETDLTIRPSVTLTAPEPFYWPNILSY